jgi:hypothetical protein
MKLLHKIKQRLRSWLYRYFREEIRLEAMRHAARTDRFVPHKLAYQFKVSYEDLRGMGNYPLGSQQLIDAQIEKGKRELFKQLPIEVVAEDTYPDFGKRYTLSVMICKEKEYVPASYQKK